MQPTPSRSSVPPGILAAMQQTNEIFNTEVVGKHNIDALDRVYTQGARVLPPGAEMLSGRGAAKTFWQAAITSMNVTSAVLATVEATQAGDGIVEIGRAVLTLASGPTVAVKYVVYWKEEDGAWKWDIDIWNPNS